MTPVLGVVGLLLCWAASFFFALAETSLFSLGKWQIRQLSDSDKRLAQSLERLLHYPQDLLATIVLGNTIANAGMIALVLWLAALGQVSLWIAIPGVFLLILIGGEVAPKTLAVRTPEVWVRHLAGPMVLLARLTRPLREVAQATINLLLRGITQRPLRPQEGLEEYQELLELAYQQGTLAESEKEIILQILRLDRRTAKDVMRPRSRMACISDELSIEEMIAEARRHRHRRLPIYDETPDTIVGVLNTRYLLLNPDADPADAIEFPSFVPETMNLLLLLKSLQRQRRGLAIVLDEFGGTAGLVTMEDILEEVLGEIRDEGEAAGFRIHKVAEGKWSLSGNTPLEDFARECPLIGEPEDVETISGLLVRELEVVPSAGQSVVYHGVRLTALEVEERRVKQVGVEVVKRR